MPLTSFGEDSPKCPADLEYRQANQLKPHRLSVNYEVIYLDYRRLCDLSINARGMEISLTFQRYYEDEMSWNSIRCLRCSDDILFRTSCRIPGNEDPKYISDESSYKTYSDKLESVVNILRLLDRNATKRSILDAADIAKNIAEYLGGIRMILENSENALTYKKDLLKIFKRIETLGIHKLAYDGS